MKKLTSIEKSFTPNQQLIKSLEIVLEDAKKGVVRSAVGVTERFNGTTGEFVWVSDDSDSLKILGSLSLLQFNISRAVSPLDPRDNPMNEAL